MIMIMTGTRVLPFPQSHHDSLPGFHFRRTIELDTLTHFPIAQPASLYDPGILWP